ncbi:MAG: sugar phosphate isomerase/epimerase [Capsulimonadaceae bacterium]|nr:sugar phosphate isomerase/epimerase [Capsulimonadaceae bacterium]
MKPLAVGVIINLEPSPEASLELVNRLGIPTVQISYPEKLDNPEGIARLRAALAHTGIEITSLVCGFAGDRYDDIATVRATVGLVPEATRTVRIAHVRKAAAFAQTLGVPRLQTHIGYVPDDPTDPAYPGIVDAMRIVCDDLQARGLVFALETGQETAEGLRRFIDDVALPNLRVNFDPANMILYGNDNPIPALDVLEPFIDGVHCKDGVWPTTEGQLGREMPLGQGDVNFTQWLTKLIDLGYRGPLTIEREISGAQQQKDILLAKALIESITAKY